mgnify:CR=1 FL=1
MSSNVLRYSLVFAITALFDLLWQYMAKKKVYICIDEKKEMLCPSEWEWIKTGEKYFEKHSVVGAMLIAGLCGVYALVTIDLLGPLIGWNIFNIIFSSWLVGIPMRYFTDPFHTYLFANLREHYYKPLGFLWSSYTDAQSGVIVAVAYHVAMCLINCKWDS